MSNILLLEDDLVLLETLQDELSLEGYRVDCAKNGQEVLDFCYENRYDLYLFDINVPDIQGDILLKEIREADDNTPAIFLTSKNREEDKVNAFYIGCDDYIVKPFSLLELKLRIRALLKRNLKKSSITYDDITIDLETNYLKIKETIYSIDPKELQILALFISQAKKVLTLESIIDELYQEKRPSSTVLRVHISKINALFEKKRIKNVRGVGYVYEN